jgi:hypothetical protein
MPYVTRCGHRVTGWRAWLLPALLISGIVRLLTGRWFPECSIEVRDPPGSDNWRTL